MMHAKRLRLNLAEAEELEWLCALKGSALGTGCRATSRAWGAQGNLHLKSAYFFLQG